jgi:putative ABC transport system permease protein
MALLRLVFRLAVRNRGRTLITALGVGVTLLAFLTLRSLVASWYSVSEAAAKSDQFEVRHKISISFVLYRRMAERIRALPGVEEVSSLVWFSGNYKDEKRRFGQLAVEPEYFRIHPEYVAPPEQMDAYLADPSAVIVGADLAKKYGWQIGDKVTLVGTIYPGDWDFTLRGIYAGESAPDRARLFMHYKHLQIRNESTHRLVVKASADAAQAIDALFANTDTPTKTESNLSVQRSWASWSASVIAAIDLAAGIVILMLMLVLGNAMAMAAREGTREYGAMRAIGFKSRHIMALVVAEAVVIATLGLALGLLVTPSALKGFSAIMEARLGGSWQLDLDVGVVIMAVTAALLAAIAAAALPAWRSSHLRICDALKRTT